MTQKKTQQKQTNKTKTPEQKLAEFNEKKLKLFQETNRKSLAVAQIDKKTQKVLNIFPNRYQVAAWALENGLTKYW